MSDYKVILRNKKFVYLWGSQVFSQITINILNFTFLFEIYRETGSTIATSMLWISYAIPALLVGPFAAASVDILDRKKVLIITNILQAAVVFIYALTFSKSIYMLFGVAMMYSLLNQFYVPAEMASLPSLVKEKGLASANSLFFMTQQVAVVVGFGSAGFLISLLGFVNILYLSSFLLLIALFSAMKLPSINQGTTLKKELESSFSGFFVSIWEGYQYIKSNNYVLGPLVILLTLNTCLTIIIVNIPALATQIFNIPIEYVGALIAAPAGLGAVMGAILVPRFLKKGYRKIQLLRFSSFMLTMSLFLLVFLIPHLRLVTKLFVSVVTIYFLGSAFITALIPTQTYLQQAIPNKLMGRVFGNYWFLSVVVSVFPVIFSGTMTEIFGIKMLIFTLSMISLSFLYFLTKHAEIFIKSGFTFSKQPNI